MIAKNQDIDSRDFIPNILVMAPDEWANVPDNPIQRDTEERAKKGARKGGHLSAYHPVHCEVKMGILPDGSCVKLDGHTRSLLWEQERLQSPRYLSVTTYHIKDMDEAADYYKKFDSREAVETARDEYHGSLRLADIQAGSDLIKNGGVTTAIRTLEGVRGTKQEIHPYVGKWAPSIRVVDTLGRTKTKFPSAVIAAMLATIAVSMGDQGRLGIALKFWEAFANGDGFKQGKTKDGVQALEELYLSAKSAGEFSGSKHADRVEFVEKAIGCFETYREGRLIERAPNQRSLSRYLEPINKARTSLV